MSNAGVDPINGNGCNGALHVDRDDLNDADSQANNRVFAFLL